MYHSGRGMQNRLVINKGGNCFWCVSALETIAFLELKKIILQISFYKQLKTGLLNKTILTYGQS